MYNIRGRLMVFLMIACLGGIHATASAKGDREEVRFSTSEAIIVTAKGRFVITVEVAATEKQRSRGLQWRTSLAPDAGMLFDFRDDRRVVMWMRNTFLPLDMLFITADGHVVQVVENTEPRSLAYIYSVQPVRAVLELNAGTVTRLDITSDTRVIHPIFLADQK